MVLLLILEKKKMKRTYKRIVAGECAAARVADVVVVLATAVFVSFLD